MSTIAIAKRREVVMSRSANSKVAEDPVWARFFGLRPPAHHLLLGYG